MKQFKRRVSTVVLSALLFSQGMMADSFVGGRTDFRDESIYFVLTTRFYDGDSGNNVLCWDNQESQKSTKDPCWRGDFQGLIDKLDYIKALGFTAIWINPVVQNASGYDYHGYHASDFSKVDCRYQSSDGSSGDVMFKKLIDAAHKKGIKIILDIVLNHTGNFGEAKLCPEFTRSEKLATQGSISCMKPNASVLGSDYDDLKSGDQYQRRLALMKNTDGENHDTHNYWHHVANAWNWDEPSRWWGQIAGDCVDLNTENPAVDEYLVKCYGDFIKLGVDGFRIDTSGHIARLSFNKAFIPQFTELGKEYASARSLYDGKEAGSPFYMFGEVCARFGGVTYRDQPNLSPYYYTWASSASDLNSWNSDASWWDNQVVPEGAAPLGNMTLCLNEPNVKKTSNNAWMLNGAYHTPDYSQSSGFNVIDFPVHYNFNNVGSVMNMVKEDNLYNDATWNVVYVDSHDYSPQPNDGIRFSGGTNQWADNLTWMFLFRGIPCLYYGSEVEFQAGKKIDNGPNGPLSDTGRAYFGQNLEGTVTASDFGVFTATGQVAKTLNHPLAKHLERLNRIRQAVPALRKGQYTTDGCSSTSGWSWKKAYNANGVNSYACVCMDGGATFTGIPNGTYKDCVTGDVQTVTDGTLTVSCPTNQGNARVYVLNGPGKIGEDGPFLYTVSAASADNSGLAADPGTTWNDVVETTEPTATVTPNGGSFTSDTQTVTITLNNATSGWYQIGDGEKVAINGSSATFTIGGDMSYGESKTVTWSATGNSDGTTETNSDKVMFTKLDPNAAITVWVKSSTAPYIYVWYKDANGTTQEPNGAWVNTKAMTATTYSGWYSYTAPAGVSSFNFILQQSAGGNKLTGDVKDVTADTYYAVSGSSAAVTSERPATTSTTPTAYTPTINDDSEISVFFETSGSEMPYVWVWDANNGNRSYNTNTTWPGDAMKLDGTLDTGAKVYKWTYTGSLTTLPTGIIFTHDGGTKYSSADGIFTNHGYYTTSSSLSATKTIMANTDSEDVYIYFLNKNNYDKVYCYLFIDKDAHTTWPGLEMSYDSSVEHDGTMGWYSLQVPEGYEDASFVINNGKDGIALNGETAYAKTATASISGIKANAKDPNAWYTITGVKVSAPTQAGIYIHNGKKVIVVK